MGRWFLSSSFLLTVLVGFLVNNSDGACSTVDYTSYGSLSSALMSLESSISGDILSSESNSSLWENLANVRWQYWHDNNVSYIIIPESEDDLVESMCLIKQRNIDWSFFSAYRSHAWIGNWAVCPGCVAISFYKFTNWTVLDTDTGNDNTKYVTVQPGLGQQELLEGLDAYDLVIPNANGKTISFGGMPQGGGYGYIARKHGLTTDYIKNFRVLNSDLEFIEVNENQYSDLFWAMRGGGAGPWGIVTEVTFEAFEPTCKNATQVQIWWDWGEDYGNKDSFDIEGLLQQWVDIQQDSENDQLTYAIYIFTYSSTQSMRVRATWNWCDDNDNNTFADNLYNYQLERWNTSTWRIRHYQGSLNQGLINQIGPSADCCDSDRKLPTTSRYIENPTTDDLNYIAGVYRGLFDDFENGLGTGLTSVLYARGGAAGTYDMDHNKTSFVMRKENLFEFTFGAPWDQSPTWNNTNDYDYAISKFETIREEAVARGWTRSYVNTPDYDEDLGQINITDDSWKYQYLNYDEEPQIYNKLLQIKKKYDCENFFDTAYRYDVSCDETEDDETSTSTSMPSGTDDMSDDDSGVTRLRVEGIYFAMFCFFLLITNSCLI